MLVLDSVFVPTLAVDLTVLRTVGVLTIRSDQGGSIESQIGSFGMIIVTDAAIAIGVSAMPDPSNDGGDAGWFVHQYFSQASTLLVGTGVNSVSYMIDSKAKRIIQSGQQIAILVKNNDAATGLSYSLQIRLLAQIWGTG